MKSISILPRECDFLCFTIPLKLFQNYALLHRSSILIAVYYSYGVDIYVFRFIFNREQHKTENDRKNRRRRVVIELNQTD